MPERDEVLLLRHFRRQVEAARLLATLAAVEELVLEEEHGIVVANGALEQALGVVGVGDADDLEPRDVHEVALGLCPCCAPRFVAPTGARITSGTETLPPDM